MADEPKGCFLLIEKAFMAMVGFLCVLYVINPTAGVIEFIPDNFPIIGNLDEATAVLMLLNCLRYFGIDLTRYFQSKQLPTGASGSKNEKP